MYNWTVGGLGAQLLPWLAILSLLALKPNRGWAAWWVWLPLALLAGSNWLLQGLQNSPGDQSGAASDILLDVPVAWGFGLAALWLLASHLGGRHPLRPVVGSLAVLTAFSLFSFAAMGGWGLMSEALGSLLDPRHCAATSGKGLIAMPLLVPLVVLGPIVAAALALCGLACRGRYRPVLLQFRFVLFLLAMWIATSLLFFWRYHFVLPGFGGCLPFLVIGLGMAVVSFAVLGPFLILSAASPFFRERLKVLLRVKEDAQT